jgi:hypothetical protein
MKKETVNFGRRLSAADMKKMQGGVRVGTGSGARCGTPPLIGCINNGNIASYNPGGDDCCKCCAGAAGALCRLVAQQDPACWLV